MIPRPKTAEAYVDLVEQTLAEIDEMRACIAYEMDGDAASVFFLTPVEEGLKTMRSGMADGTYFFENSDLAFMSVVNRYKSEIPFAAMLATINRTHRQGLDVD